MNVGSLDAAECRDRLRSSSGLTFRTGPFTSRVTTSLPDVAAAFHTLYGDYPLVSEPDFVDFQVGVRRPFSLRAVWNPQVVFSFEGQEPFNPLPGDQGFPLLEWGLNWCVYAHCHQYLILHAAVLERHGRALVLPAPSGSGKSTLCAALTFAGWRLLSDELALISPGSGQIVPNPRPVSLKNESIEVIRRFAPHVKFGSRVEETVKGVVAHFAAPTASVAAAEIPVLPGWIVLPRYVSGSSATLEPLERARAFIALVENAFNYDVFGAEGFELLGSVVDRSQAFAFEYSNIQEAVQLFDRMAGGDLPAVV